MSLCTQCGNEIIRGCGPICLVCQASEEKLMNANMTAVNAALEAPEKDKYGFPKVEVILGVPTEFADSFDLIGKPVTEPLAVPVVIEKLLERCNALTFDDKAHNEDWKNQIAHDLNFILTRVEYCLEMEEGDETDISFAESALRIVERVAEFEQITEVDEKADADEKAFYAACEPHHAGDDEK